MPAGDIKFKSRKVISAFGLPIHVQSHLRTDNALSSHSGLHVGMKLPNA